MLKFCKCLKVTILVIALGASIIGFAALQNTIEPVSNEFFDVQPADEHISYLYCPGIFATEMAMGRYCPKFTAVTGESFAFKKGGHVIGQPHTAVIFPEIDLRKPNYFTFNPITAYINRIRADLFPIFSRIFKNTYDFEVIENPNSKLSVINYGFNFGQANDGQTKDIKALHKAYHEHLEKYPNTGIVAYGDSRGANVWFNFIAEYHPTQVKAAVLESITDDMDHQIKHLFFIDKGEAAESRLLNLYSWIVGSFKKNGPSARKNAEIITDDIPLLLVASLADGIVAPEGVVYIYNRLRERGHQKVHLLMLNKPSHPGYMLDNNEDKENYEAVVHAFYKHYNLPHNSAKAKAGAALFAASQPTDQEIEQLYKLPACRRCWVCPAVAAASN